MATTREKLLQAAVKLFSKKGFRETTVGQIEAAAGLSPRAGAFYRHFRSKQEILDVGIEWLSERVAEGFSVSELLPLGDIRAELLVIGRTILMMAKHHQDLRIVLRARARQDPKIAERLRALNRNFYDQYLTAWTARIISENNIAGYTASQLSSLIFGPVLYHMLQRDVGLWPFEITDDTLLEPWADFWARALEGMAGKPALHKRAPE